MSKNYSAPNFHRELTELWQNIGDLKQETKDLFHRSLPAEMQDHLRFYLPKVFRGEPDNFKEGFRNFLKERNLFKELYEIWETGDQEYFYGWIDDYLGGDFFPKEADNKYDLAKCENIWRQYAKRAYDYVAEIAEEVDPQAQNLSVGVEFSAGPPDVFIQAVIGDDARKSYEAVVLLKLMLLEANIDRQVRQLEDSSAYSIYFSKDLGDLVAYLSGEQGKMPDVELAEGKPEQIHDQEALLSKGGKEYKMTLSLNPDDNLRVYGYRYAPKDVAEENYVIMEPEAGDYQTAYPYQLTDPRWEDRVIDLKQHLRTLPKKIADKFADKSPEVLRKYFQALDKKAIRLEKKMIPISVFRALRSIRLIEYDLDDKPKAIEAPVELLYRIKPEQSLKSKMVRKDRENIAEITDIGGLKFSFMNYPDALKSLPRIMATLPPIEKAEFSNNLFNSEDLKETLDGSVLQKIKDDFEKLATASDSNWRCFKYIASVNKKRYEIQITLFPYSMNEIVSLGPENHNLFRLRQYLDTLIPLFFYTEAELSYQRPWFHICEQIYNHYRSSGAGRTDRDKFPTRLEFIENAFVDYLIKFIKNNFQRLTHSKDMIPSGMDDKDISLPKWLDTEIVEQDLKQFRAAMYYLRNKVTDITALIKKHLQGLSFKKELKTRTVIDQVAQSSIIKILLDSYLEHARLKEKNSILEEVERLEAYPLHGTALLLREMPILIERASYLMDEPNLEKWINRLKSGLSRNPLELQAQLTELKNDLLILINSD